MELAAPNNSLRGEFDTSKFVGSISGPQRNGNYRSKKHRGGQPKQSQGGGGESIPSTQGISPRVRASEMGGNTSRGVVTGRTTVAAVAGSTVAPSSPTEPVASSRPAQQK